MPQREDFTWETNVDTASLTDPKDQVKASIWQGKLHVHIQDQSHDIDLPEDAFTDDAHAQLSARKLSVRIARRDPNGPAMQEKRLFNPDRHPVALDIDMSRELAAKGGIPPNPLSSSKTPAQISAGEFSAVLVGSEPAHAHKMPGVNMGSSIVTSMPVMVNQGGVLDTVSKGETVVQVPGSTETHHLTGVSGQDAAELAAKMKDTAVRDAAPPGAAVLSGQKPKETEAAFDERAIAPARGLAAGGGDGGAAGGDTGVTGVGRLGGVGGVGAPAGDEEHMRATGEHGEKVRSDFTMNKVGMEYEELNAADVYVGAESKSEPISSVKVPGAPLCEMCACAPCQCSKVAHTGSNPWEMTPPETKRAGRPAIHTRHREVTGVNAHEAHNYRGHAKQVREGHVGIGAKLSEYKGNVPEGVGDPSDPKYTHMGHPQPRGATHTGGTPIALGGPGRTQDSDHVKGGPVVGGSKTTFTTLG